MCGGDGEYDIDWDVELDNMESDSVHRFIATIDSILAKLDLTNDRWHFIHVAILFLQYAFASKGRQRLLSYITVIEALLGEQKETVGLKNLLQRRLKIILGKNRFDQLYDLRSKLVHGDEKMRDPMPVERIREARDLAHKALIWFLHYLDHVRQTTRDDEGLPTREELLSLLDRDNTESRERVKQLLEVLPADFPRTSGWTDY
jgi:Apea-like HEPN